MKIPLLQLSVFSAVGLLAASAQSTPAAASRHTGNAASQAAGASGESALAVASAAGSGLKLVSAVGAVPLWLAGSTVVASGEAAKAGAERLWDLATSEPAARPKLNPKIGLPPAPPPKPAVVADPSPAEALKRL